MTVIYSDFTAPIESTLFVCLFVSTNNQPWRGRRALTIGYLVSALTAVVASYEDTSRVIMQLCEVLEISYFPP